MTVGDKVTHDFSGGSGIIIEIDRTNPYPFKVKWSNGKIDWYKPKVLKVVK